MSIRLFYTLKLQDFLTDNTELFEILMNNFVAYFDDIYPRFIEGLKSEIRALVLVKRPRFFLQI